MPIEMDFEALGRFAWSWFKFYGVLIIIILMIVFKWWKGFKTMMGRLWRGE